VLFTETYDNTGESRRIYDWDVFTVDNKKITERLSLS
jgi:hypothetical protein